MNIEKYKHMLTPVQQAQFLILSMCNMITVFKLSTDYMHNKLHNKHHDYAMLWFSRARDELQSNK